MESPSRRDDQLHLHVVVPFATLHRALDLVFARLGRSYHRKLLDAILQTEVPSLVFQGGDGERVYRSILVVPLGGAVRRNAQDGHFVNLHGDDWVLLLRDLETVILVGDDINYAWR